MLYLKIYLCATFLCLISEDINVCMSKSLPAITSKCQLVTNPELIHSVKNKTHRTTKQRQFTKKVQVTLIKPSVSPDNRKRARSIFQKKTVRSLERTQTFFFLGSWPLIPKYSFNNACASLGMFISCPKKNNLSDSKARQLDVIHFDMESGDDSMVMTVVLMAVGRGGDNDHG